MRGLREEGGRFESIIEKTETTSVAGKLAFHVLAALADFECNLIRERTQGRLSA
ncbi:recombinase family protein [Duganella vulcania]|uniref:recombinase family protein n=1 Tax=Duganella vulcania TaxID=2692166 RepID=UPI0020C20030|nr:recombinase family protein [Duganella vulcania]